MEIKAFILSHYRYLTYTQMAYELNVPLGTVAGYCQKLSITPITVKAQTKQFILAHYKTKTIKKIAQLLNYTEATVIKWYGKLGIVEPEELLREKVEPVSARQAFSEFKIHQAKHYHLDEESITENVSI